MATENANRTRRAHALPLAFCLPNQEPSTNHAPRTKNLPLIEEIESTVIAGHDTIAGCLSKASTCVVLTGNVLKQTLGVPLSDHENDVEAASKIPK